MSRAQFLKLLVSLGLLAAAFFLLDLRKLIDALREFDPWMFSYAVLISCLVNGVLALRWHQIILKVAPLPLLEHMKLFFYGTFLNSFTPANVGGDAYRLVALRAHAPGSGPVFTALVRERFLGLFSFLSGYLICLGALWFFDSATLGGAGKIFLHAGVFIMIGTVALVLSSPLLAFLAGWSRDRPLRWLTAAFSSFSEAARIDSPVGFGKLLALSLLALSGWFLTVWVIARGLGLELHWAHLGAIVILVELLRLIPVSIQGIGVREGSYAYLFGASFQTPEVGFILGTISYLALSLSLLIGGLIGWALMCFVPPKVEGLNK